MENKINEKIILLIFCFISFIPALYANLENTYRIQPGDIINISVLGEEELFREVRVSSNGKVSYPLIGEVDVVGMTTYELNSLLTKRLNEYLVNPQISIFIAEFAKIFVFGEVVNPGAFELSKSISLLESITLAGGLTEHANLKKVKIMRKNGESKKVINVDLTSITERGEQENDIILFPGDMVIVPESFL